MKNKIKTPLYSLLLIGALMLTSCQNKQNNDEQIYENKFRNYYQLLVYSFADSDGDGIGDFKGISEKLTYLKDLGIEALWLSPIFEAVSYHGYDAVDFYKVNPKFEVDDYKFEDLVADAKVQDINIILDLAINHTSSYHPWFLQASSAYRINGESKYINWYNFSKTKTKVYTGGSSGAYYEAIFWDQMPDLNFDNTEVRQEMINVGKYWLNKGATGFRLDAAMHIYNDYEGEDKWNSDVYDKNIAWWRQFSSSLKKDYPHAYFVGEMWTSLEKIQNYYASGLDSAFNFKTKDNISLALSGNEGYAQFLINFQQAIKNKNIDAIEANFLSNHDAGRMSEKVSDIASLKMAASLMTLTPGNSFIYYGDEIGLYGQGGSGDPKLRTPMLFEGVMQTKPNKYGIGNSFFSKTIDDISLADHLEDENSLWHYYQKLLMVKKENIELKMGTISDADINVNGLIAYQMKYKDSTSLIIHNISPDEITVNIPENNQLLLAISAYNQVPTITNGSVTLNKYATVVVKYI